MTRIAVLAVFLMVTVALAAQAPKPRTQTPKTPTPTGTSGRAGDEAALIEIENMWPDAVMKKDVAVLERIDADELTDIAPDGTMTTKTQDIEDLRTGTFLVESATASDLKPRVYGDMAVVTGITDLKGKYKDQDISGRYRFTDTFVRRNGEWKLVATQATKIMEKQDQ